MKKTLQTLVSVSIAALSFSAYASSSTLPIEDGVITAKIKTKIAADRSLTNSTVNVNTNDGIVNISGNVKSDAQAGALIEIAESTDGVKNVEVDKLHVAKSKHKFLDTTITAKVKGTFLREKLFGDSNTPVMNIHVETNNGVVYLTGKANTQKQINTAISLANSIDGVKKVENRIKLTHR